MTAESCSSGSERIASVADALMNLAWGDEDSCGGVIRPPIINVQGDQPFIDPAVIDAMVVEEFLGFLIRCLPWSHRFMR